MYNILFSFKHLKEIYLYCFIIIFITEEGDPNVVSLEMPLTMNVWANDHVSFLSAKKRPRYISANIPAIANNIRAESLKSSFLLSFAWCCLLISLLTCFSFRVSWPILFLYKDQSLKCQISSSDIRVIPVLIYRRSRDPILASSIDAWSCHCSGVQCCQSSQCYTITSVSISSHKSMYKTKTGSHLEKIIQSERQTG